MALRDRLDVCGAEDPGGGTPYPPSIYIKDTTYYRRYAILEKLDYPVYLYVIAVLPNLY